MGLGAAAELQAAAKASNANRACLPGDLRNEAEMLSTTVTSSGAGCGEGTAAPAWKKYERTGESADRAEADGRAARLPCGQIDCSASGVVDGPPDA